MSDEKDFNPLVFKPQEEDDDMPATISATRLDTAAAATPLPMYSREEYEDLYRRYLEQKKRSEAYADNFFALADIMYQLLVYQNIHRLFQGKSAVMANDVAREIESSPLLSQIVGELRETAIRSGCGLITEMETMQEYLRTHVMHPWRDRFCGDRRQHYAAQIYPDTDSRAADGQNHDDELF